MRDQPETLSQQRFGRLAQKYVDSVTHAQLANLDHLVELAQPQADWVMLDVATGGGHTALRFAAHVGHVTASDVTPRMLRAAEQHLLGRGVTNVDFRLVDAQAVPFDGATFNLVTCRIAPHHFEDAARFVQEASRVLKPGGTLLVHDNLVPEGEVAARYIQAFEKLRDPSHNRAYTESEWRAMFADAGLAVVHTESLQWPLHFKTWTQRQEVTPSTEACLVTLIDVAPQAVRDWMRPTGWGTDEAVFTYRHGIVKGIKPAAG